MTRRLVLGVLLGFVTAGTAYVAVILVFLAAGDPINDRSRNRFSDWVLAVVATGVAAALAVGTSKALSAVRHPGAGS